MSINDPNFDAYVIPLFYGIWTICAVGLAWLSGKHVWFKVAMLLFLAWVCCNVAVKAQGLPNAPLLIPAIDAFIGVSVGSLALANRDRIAAVVFALFVVDEIIHVAAFLTHWQGAYTYYLALNAVFIAQIAVVGGASAWTCLADGSYSRVLRSYARSPDS